MCGACAMGAIVMELGFMSKHQRPPSPPPLPLAIQCWLPLSLEHCIEHFGVLQGKLFCLVTPCIPPTNFKFPVSQVTTRVSGTHTSTTSQRFSLHTSTRDTQRPHSSALRKNKENRRCCYGNAQNLYQPTNVRKARIMSKINKWVWENMKTLCANHRW
jgi:hypothetical protein